MRARPILGTLALAVALAAPGSGCLCGATGRGSDSGGGGGDGGSNGGGDGGGGGVDGGGGSSTDAAPCVATNVGATTATRPVDIIWIIDNSGSMDYEEGQVQANMDTFATMVGGFGIDYHVVVITDTSHISITPTDPTRFRFVNQNVDSNNSLVLILSTYPLWQDFLRPGAVRHFVEVSDDESTDLSASSFLTMLGALTMPGFPATATEPYGFIFHAIVAEDDPLCNASGFPCPCTAAGCACIFTAAARGQEYITLQTMTGGVFNSLCALSSTSWGPVFSALAAATMANTMLPCNFEIPPAPMGMTIDYDAVNFSYTPSGGTAAYIPRVASMAACGPTGGWYYDDPVMPTMLIACPATCTVLMNDPGGVVEVAFGCGTIIQ
ncbi:MAG TPA: hypothetical protein VG389_24740 [Myxococcota bacterium]|jgi:hypothetical protein|nr:hypothetical protein [Myxococcota bacterium]